MGIYEASDSLACVGLKGSPYETLLHLILMIPNGDISKEAFLYSIDTSTPSA